MEKKYDERLFNVYMNQYCVSGEFDKVKEVLDRFESNVDLHFPLVMASRNGHIALVKLFIDKGASVNPKNVFDENGDFDYESSPIIEASKNSHIGVIDFLVKNGSNIQSAFDNYPGTKEKLMSELKKIEMSESLISAKERLLKGRKDNTQRPSF